MNEFSGITNMLNSNAELILVIIAIESLKCMLMINYGNIIRMHGKIITKQRILVFTSMTYYSCSGN